MRQTGCRIGSASLVGIKCFSLSVKPRSALQHANMLAYNSNNFSDKTPLADLD